jgi:hypothetical protein
MAGWLAASLALAVLIARLPHATWPEQFGLVCGMFAAVFAGSWWLGLGGWAAARLAWAADRARSRRALVLNRG